MHAIAFPSMIVVLALFAGCGSKAPQTAERQPAPIPASGLRGDFGGQPDVMQFIRRMEREHGFDPEQLARLLAQAQREQWIVEQMDRQAPSPATGPNGAWNRYRARFVTGDNIANGLAFWHRHAAALGRAQARYGVPPQYVVAIIGVETRYGDYLGKTRILDALATLAFAYPRRAAYFSSELEDFLIMTRDEGIDPRQPRGSFAGAMGLGQFMPSSFRRHAVDFDGDGHRDLWNPVDAIGSVAHYFESHGWRAPEPVATPALVQTGGRVAGLKVGFDTRYTLEELAAAGVTPDGALAGQRAVSLIRLDVGGSQGYEYWLGLPNFYVITRYNHSSYYAMAVHQLAEAMRARRAGPGGARISQQSGEGGDSRL